MARRHCTRFGKGRGGRKVCRKFAKGAMHGARRRRRRR